MNVTIRIPPSLRTAVDGREVLNLGLPPTADVGDLVDTLLSLYPKLRAFMAGETKKDQTAISLFLSEPALKDLASRRKGLREGQVIYLVGGIPRRPVARS